ncbi:permease [Draconibacterium sediminis]|uniref:permease n=1 Tax=Draconibacterium sediminis TaxID=1544798 RepID=UPI0026F23CB7|nr:permease [Draconibacterium sediminis]
MKETLKKNRINIVIISAFTVFVAVSFVVNFSDGENIFKEQFYSFFKEMILFLPVMFILIGLGDVWISKEKVEKHIGKNSGFKGILLVIFLSMAQVGPLYGAFPVTYLLWKKGASIRNIFIYIGAFCTIKIPMITFEIGFLGWKFSLLRTLFSLPIIIIISIIMERILKNKSFEVKQP